MSWATGSGAEPYWRLVTPPGGAAPPVPAGGGVAGAGRAYESPPPPAATPPNACASAARARLPRPPLPLRRARERAGFGAAGLLFAGRGTRRYAVPPQRGPHPPNLRARPRWASPEGPGRLARLRAEARRRGGGELASAPGQEPPAEPVPAYRV